MPIKTVILVVFFATTVLKSSENNDHKSFEKLANTFHEQLIKDNTEGLLTVESENMILFRLLQQFNEFKLNENRILHINRIIEESKKNLIQQQQTRK